ncbi:sensor histidine kinase [Reinekea blandensis]|uniref:histidine kinase n=1 Tax=Reinekea blandensis MED297 TaxID=314283 RepID=A4BDJ9_9GAMM|nr:ATP-binding protein [Reinekea blandensis]EAR09943.1 Periplasmic Sensor Signal Transduction Histidine Kinase [Reinekea sp. MED297] [Reinekea blandensis MED297]
MFSKAESLLRSSSFRFALLTGLIIWATTASILVVAYLILENSLWQRIRSGLSQEAERIQALVLENPDLDIETLSGLLPESDTSGRRRFQNGMMAMHNSPAMQEHHASMGLVTPPGHLLGEGERVTDSNGQRVYQRDVQLPDGSVLILSRDIGYLSDVQRSLWLSLGGGLLLTLIIAILAAIWLTQRSLRRIHQINAASQIIRSGHFDHRIPYANPQGHYDDYDRMANHINAMLDEIHSLAEKNRQVSDNIAHDLKAPLARLRTRLEQAQVETPSDHVSDSLAELDRLFEMIQSLLRIARIESQTTTGFESLNLDDLMADLIEMYVPVFEDRQVRLTLNGHCGTVHGDRHLLFQAFANVLDNAAKFTPPGGEVRLEVSRNDDVIDLVIQDSGPGIAEASLERVFERFHREDSARSTQGFGLGLSLVRAIIERHDGQVRLSNHHGLRVAIRLPV